MATSDAASADPVVEAIRTYQENAPANTSNGTSPLNAATGSPVGNYPNEFPFTGTIDRIDVTLRPEAVVSAHDVADGQLRGALGTQ